MGLFDSLFGKKQPAPAKQPAQVQRPIASQPVRGNVSTQKVYLDADVFDSLLKRYIAFDVETTGLSAAGDRIVELGAVLVENGNVVSRFGSLVNAGVQISASASAVNHITNEMLKKAPTEQQVYPSFLQFMGDALHGDTIICAHNADFDMGFLSNTLRRLGVNAEIRYIDTLYLSRQTLKLPNHKQETIAAHFGIVNESAHRAVSDAQVCANILWKLMQLREQDVEAQKARQEARKPSEEELEICAVIQRSIMQHGGDIKYLSFDRNSNGYVVGRCQYNFIQFKSAKKGRYIVIPSNIKTPSDLPIEPCTMSEGGTAKVRLYFSSPFNLEFLDSYFWQAYKEAYTGMKEYTAFIGSEREVLQQVRESTTLRAGEVESILAKAATKNYASAPAPIEKKVTVRREDVVINAVHNRCALSRIRNYGNFDRGFQEGYPLWERAEVLRKAGDLEGALVLYDKAREAGYDAPALYNSYAILYRKLKDYDNEIVILEEGIDRMPGPCDEWKARRDKALELLYAKQQAEKAAAERAAKKAEKARAGQAAGESGNGGSAPKPILQMDDDGTVIREYESVSQAVKETGVNAKSIRDAANGVQKHAGGFVWKFKE